MESNQTRSADEQSVLQNTDSQSVIATPCETTSPEVSTTKSLLFCVGGGGKNSKTAAVYEIDSKCWYSIESTNTKHNDTAAVAWNNTVVVAGGEAEPDATNSAESDNSNSKKSNVTNSVEQFDPQTGKWTNLANLGTARRSHALVNVEGALYVFGGWSGEEDLKSVERYNAENRCWESIGSLMVERIEFAAAYCSKGVVISGGYNTQSSCELYDPIRNSSVTIALLNCNRHGHAAATHNDTVYIFGGCCDLIGLDCFAAIEQYDADVDRWTLLKPKLTKARCDLAAACVDERTIYIVGGGNSKLIEVFDPTADISSATELPEERWGHGVAFLKVPNDQFEKMHKTKLT